MLFRGIQQGSEDSKYRAYAYYYARSEMRYLSRNGDIQELRDWLDNEVNSGRATGGEIEVYLPRVGWVVYKN